MNAKVLKDFSCRIRGIVYRAGDVYEGDSARIAELAAGGYVEGQKPEKAKSTATTKRRTTRRASTKKE